jgi:YD repeat-containing protein
MYHTRSSLEVPTTMRRFAACCIVACAFAGCAGSGDDRPVSVEPQVQQLTSPQTVVTYTYDSLGRLRTAEYPAATKRIVINYDRAGNRVVSAIDTTITNPNPTPPNAPP